MRTAGSPDYSEDNTKEKNMDKLTDQSCASFTQALAAKQSVPGGGGAAALAGALGVALCSMVGNFTLGKKKYAGVEEDVKRMLAQGEALRLRLLELVDADAQAFAPLAEAYAIPKDDPAHDQVLEAATLNACQAPMEMVRCCAQAIGLLEEMLEKGSRMLLSDVGCGALLCKAAMESAAMNVFVNTAGLKNREEADQIEAEMDQLLARYLPRAQSVAQAVTQKIRGER
jgi:formiminotetrahydrofolate cyclodeaminase